MEDILKSFRLGIYTKAAKRIIHTASQCMTYAMNGTKWQFNSEVRPLGCLRASFKGELGSLISSTYAKSAIDNEVILYTRSRYGFASSELKNIKAGLINVLKLMKLHVENYPFNGKAYMYQAFFVGKRNTLFNYIEGMGSHRPKYDLTSYVFETDDINEVEMITAKDINDTIKELSNPTENGKETDEFILEEKKLIVSTIVKLRNFIYENADDHTIDNVLTEKIFDKGYLQDIVEYNEDNSFVKTLFYSTLYEDAMEVDKMIKMNENLRLPDAKLIYSNAEYFKDPILGYSI